MAQRPTRRPDKPRTPDFDDLVTPAEAAKITGMAEYTLRRWARQGRVTGYRIGTTTVRFSRSELSSLITVIPADSVHGGAA